MEQKAPIVSGEGRLEGWGYMGVYAVRHNQHNLTSQAHLSRGHFVQHRGAAPVKRPRSIHAPEWGPGEGG